MVCFVSAALPPCLSGTHQAHTYVTHAHTYVTHAHTYVTRGSTGHNFNHPRRAATTRGKSENTNITSSLFTDSLLPRLVKPIDRVTGRAWGDERHVGVGAGRETEEGGQRTHGECYTRCSVGVGYQSLTCKIDIK